MKENVWKMPKYDVKLSTGYAVPIDGLDIDKDISHLCTAFIMEILIPNLKKLGTKNAIALLQNEIVDVCCTLNDKSKTSLLSALLWHSVLNRYDEIEKMVKKGKVKSQKK